MLGRPNAGPSLHSRTGGIDFDRTGAPAVGSGKAACRAPAVRQMSTSSPLRSRRLRSFNDGPLGRFCPISHWRTVDKLVFRIDARTAWLSLWRARKARIFLLE